MTPEALAGNILINGEPVPGIGSSIGTLLDATSELGTSPSSSDANRNDVPDDQALLDDPNQDQDEDQNEADGP